MLSLTDIQLINQLCFSPLDSNQIQVLVKLHSKIFNIDFDYTCEPCIAKAKMDIAKKAIEQMVQSMAATEYTKQNGQFKN
jgi:hypothetical protein